MIVDHAIIDKQCWLGKQCRIGYGDANTPNHDEPEYLTSGITVVGKGARIPPRIKIGRNCQISSRVEEDEFTAKFIPSGTSVNGKVTRRARM